MAELLQNEVILVKQERIGLLKPDLKLHKDFLPVIRKNHSFPGNMPASALRLLAFAQNILDKYSGRFFYDFDFSAFVFLEQFLQERSKEKERLRELEAAKAAAQVWNIFERHMHLALGPAIRVMNERYITALEHYYSPERTKIFENGGQHLKKPPVSRLYITSRLFQKTVNHLRLGNDIPPARKRIAADFFRQSLVWERLQELLRSERAGIGYSAVLRMLSDERSGNIMNGAPDRALGQTQGEISGRAPGKLSNALADTILNEAPGVEKKDAEKKLQQDFEQRLLDVLIQLTDSEIDGVQSPREWVKHYEYFEQITGVLEKIIGEKEYLSEIYKKVNSEFDKHNFKNFKEEKLCFLGVIKTLANDQYENIRLENLIYRVDSAAEEQWRQIWTELSQAEQSAGRVKELAVYLQAKAKLWNADKAGGSAPELGSASVPQYMQTLGNAAALQYMQTPGNAAELQYEQTPRSALMPQYEQTPRSALMPQYVQIPEGTAAPQLVPGVELLEGWHEAGSQMAAAGRTEEISADKAFWKILGTMEENSLKTWIEEYRRMILRHDLVADVTENYERFVSEHKALDFSEKKNVLLERLRICRMEHWELFHKLTDETAAGAILNSAPARLFTAAGLLPEISVKTAEFETLSDRVLKTIERSDADVWETLHRQVFLQERKNRRWQTFEEHREKSGTSGRALINHVDKVLELLKTSVNLQNSVDDLRKLPASMLYKHFEESISVKQNAVDESIREILSSGKKNLYEAFSHTHLWGMAQTNRIEETIRELNEAALSMEAAGNSQSYLKVVTVKEFLENVQESVRAFTEVVRETRGQAAQTAHGATGQAPDVTRRVTAQVPDAAHETTAQPSDVKREATENYMREIVQKDIASILRGESVVIVAPKTQAAVRLWRNWFFELHQWQERRVALALAYEAFNDEYASKMPEFVSSIVGERNFGETELEAEKKYFLELIQKYSEPHKAVWSNEGMERLQLFTLHTRQGKQLMELFSLNRSALESGLPEIFSARGQEAIRKLNQEQWNEFVHTLSEQYGSKDEMIVQRRQLENTFHILEAAQEVYEAFVKNVENEAGAQGQSEDKAELPSGSILQTLPDLILQDSEVLTEKTYRIFSDTVRDYVKTHSDLKKVVESTESELVYRSMAEIFSDQGIQALESAAFQGQKEFFDRFMEVHQKVERLESFSGNEPESKYGKAIRHIYTTFAEAVSREGKMPGEPLAEEERKLAGERIAGKEPGIWAEPIAAKTPGARTEHIVAKTPGVTVKHIVTEAPGAAVEPIVTKAPGAETTHFVWENSRVAPERIYKIFSDTVRDYMRTHSELKKELESKEPAPLFRNIVNIFAEQSFGRPESGNLGKWQESFKSLTELHHTMEHIYLPENMRDKNSFAAVDVIPSLEVKTPGALRGTPVHGALEPDSTRVFDIAGRIAPQTYRVLEPDGARSLSPFAPIMPPLFRRTAQEGETAAMEDIQNSAAEVYTNSRAAAEAYANASPADTVPAVSKVFAENNIGTNAEVYVNSGTAAGRYTAAARYAAAGPLTAAARYTAVHTEPYTSAGGGNAISAGGGAAGGTAGVTHRQAGVHEEILFRLEGIIKEQRSQVERLEKEQKELKSLITVQREQLNQKPGEEARAFDRFMGQLQNELRLERLRRGL